MKKQHYSIKVRMAAFAVLVSFTAVSCPQVSTPDAAPQSPKTEKPLINIPITPEDGTPVVTPVRFYLNDDYEPAETDTGKTAFGFNGPGDLEKFLATAEEHEKGTVVRFLDDSKGMTASMYFLDGDPFPASFTLYSEEDGTVSGAFSPYDEEEETFGLVLKYGGETSEPLEDFPLNKNVFGLYEDDPALSAGENTRMRNYVTALSVWTAMAYQFGKAMKTGEYESALSGFRSAGIEYFYAGGVVENIGRGIQKAVENICTIGATIAAAAVVAFKITASIIVTVATGIGVTVAAPVVAAVAVAVAITVTLINLEKLGREEEENSGGDSGGVPEPDTPPLPPEQRKAPRFTIYYIDEAGERQDLPVMKEGEAPTIADKFYIRPHNKGLEITSIVKFCFEIASVEPPDGEVKTSMAFSPRQLPYQEVGVKPEDGGGYYFEVRKNDGYRSLTSIDTTLTIKVFNGTATTDEKKPVYFPYYYVNGIEFEKDAGFVINFIDLLSAGDEPLVRIPQHTVSEDTAPSYNYDPWRPLVNRIPATDQYTLFPGTTIVPVY